MMFLRKTLAPVAALAIALAAPTATLACSVAGQSELIVEIEALNTDLQTGDYPGFVENVSLLGGFDATGIADQIAAAFPKGFETCRTILQRRDVGEMTQTISQFNAPGGTLYLYTLSAIEVGAFTLLSLNVSTDATQALANLR